MSAHQPPQTPQHTKAVSQGSPASPYNQLWLSAFIFDIIHRKIKKSPISCGTEHFDLPEANASLWLFFSFYIHTSIHIHLHIWYKRHILRKTKERVPLFEHAPFLKNFASCKKVQSFLWFGLTALNVVLPDRQKIWLNQSFPPLYSTFNRSLLWPQERRQPLLKL